MFGMRNKSIERPTAESILLEKISAVLFPPFYTRDVAGDKYSIDSSVDTNVDAVLTDLRDGYLDETCLETLQAVFNKLHEVRNIIGAHHEMDPAVSQYIIAMRPPTDSVSEIEPAEDNDSL